jgi:hypothetical protein
MQKNMYTPEHDFWEVYCNDKLLNYCIEADDEEGWAKCLSTNINGEVQFDWQDEPIVGMVRGKIEFKYIGDKNDI